MTTEPRTISRATLPATGPFGARDHGPGWAADRPTRHQRPLPGRATVHPRARGRTHAWVRRHSVSLPLVGGLLAVVAVVHASGAGGYPGFADDEGTYVAQAWAVMTQHGLAHYTYWYDHPPLGWLQLAIGSSILAPFMKAGSAVAGARGMMLMPALASAALTYLLARRLGIVRGFAALAVLLFALCPLAVTLMRQVYLDNFALPWMLGAFVLAASPGRRLWAYAGSGACFCVAVLSKETMLIALPGLVLLLWQSLDRRRRAFCLTAFGTVFVLGLMAYPLYATLKGELLPGHGHVSLFEAVRFQLLTRPSTGTALSSSSVSHQLVHGWFRDDPWLLSLGTALALPALAVRRFRPVAASLLCLVIMALRPGYLPEPFVIAMLPLCALVVAGTLDLGFSAARRLRGDLRQHALAAAALAAGALALVIAPAWFRENAFASNQHHNDGVVAAKRWIDSHLDRRNRILVDDTLYVDLVRAGFKQRFGVVWFYKLDFTTNLDPSIARNLPQGWRAFDYVVSTPVIRSALQQQPQGLQQVRLALQHSRPVATFAGGNDRVEVRKSLGIATGWGLVPKKPILTHLRNRPRQHRPAQHPPRQHRR